MKLELTTVYENVDQEWLEWWIKNNGPVYGIEAGDEFFTTGKPRIIKSKDPTCNVCATTEIKVSEWWVW